MSGAVEIQPPRGWAARVAIRREDECWPWQGPTRRGYGALSARVDGRRQSVGPHQLAYWEATGRWEAKADGRMVRHLCHNPLCCNPRHLAGGTGRDNAADRRAREQGRPLVFVGCLRLPVAGIANDPFRGASA